MIYFYIHSLEYRTGVSLGNTVKNGNGTIWLDNVICDGTECSIEECQHMPWGEEDCSHGEDVGVKCLYMCSKWITVSSLKTSTASIVKLNITIIKLSHIKKV